MWIIYESEKGLEISATTCILSVFIILYDTQILVGPFQLLEGNLTLNASSIHMSQYRFIAYISRRGNFQLKIKPFAVLVHVNGS